MRAVFPLGILLSAALTTPGFSLQQGPSLGEILLVEQHRAQGNGELEVLFRGIASRDTLVLRRAIRALGRLERPALAERLFPLLAHPLPGVRTEAAQAVAQLAQGLRGDSARGAAITTALGERVLSENDPAVRGMLALSLGRLPYNSTEAITRAREWLLRLGDGAEGTTLLDVARGMETHARLTARRLPLPQLLTNRLAEWFPSATLDPRTRRAVLGALLNAQAAGGELLAAALSLPDPLLRRLALTGVLRLPPLMAAELAHVALKDSSALVRAEALRSVARAAGKGSCPDLIAATHDVAPMVALLSLDLLGTTCAGEPLAIAALVDAVQATGGSWHPAAHALLSLARLAPERALAAFPAARSAPRWQRRLYAARTAAILKDTAALRRLGRDGVANVREAALAGLHELTGHADDSLFRAALGSADYQLVLTAANALAGTPARDSAAEASLQALERLTRDARETSRDPRVALLVRLRETGTPALAPRLEPFLRDFDPAIADSAAALLKVWTGQTMVAAPRRQAPLGFSLAALERLRGKRLRFTMESGGVFEVELLTDEAPMTVLRVASLAAQGYYNGLTFHRVVPNFVIQGGSPGANEYAGAARFMPDELGSGSHARGTLGISTRGRDTGDAQLFINLVDNPRLDYEYTVWGRVVSGLPEVDALLEGAVIRKVEIRSR